MKSIFAVSLLSSLVATLSIGCGGGLKLGSHNKEQAERQVQATKSLKSFMDQNADIAAMSLQSIRGAGDDGKSSLSLNGFANEEIGKSIDPKKAVEANELLDDVFKQLSFEDFFYGAMRIIAVAAGLGGDESGYPEESDGSEPVPVKGDSSGSFSNKIDSLFTNAMAVAPKAGSGGKDGPTKEGAPEKPKGAPRHGGGNGPGMTCQEIMDRPGEFLDKASGGEVTEGKIKDAITEANKEFKKHVSECPSVDGAKFAKCTEELSRVIAKINAGVTCSIKDMKELERIMGDTGDKLLEAVKACQVAFKKCNFTSMDFMGGPEQDMPVEEGAPVESGDEKPIMKGEAKPTKKAMSVNE